MDIDLSRIPTRNGYPTYSDGELARRHDHLRSLMDTRGYAAIVVAGATTRLDSPVRYYTNWPPQLDAFYLFTADERQQPSLFVWPYNHLPNCREVARVDDIRYGGPTLLRSGESLAQEVRERGLSGTRIGVIGSLRYQEAHQLTATADVALDDCNADYLLFRLTKSPEELEFVRVAARMCDAAVTSLRDGIEPGMPEYALSSMVQRPYLAERGTDQIHFIVTTSMADPHGCVPRQQLSDRRLASGDVLATEISVDFWGYCGQILRTFTIDGPPTDLYRELHAVALDTYRGIVEELRAGVTVGRVLDLTDGIAERGFTILDSVVHGYGGGGLMTPSIRTKESGGPTGGAVVPQGFDLGFEFAPDMLFVVQPNVVSRDHRAGVQLGNMVRITEDGVEVLHDHPMDLQVVGSS